MAGIGFELRKILEHDDFLSEVKAYIYSSLISSGPWVLSISCIAILGMLHIPGMELKDHEIFRATITYTYAFSLIYTGIYQLVVTRFLADRLYVNDDAATLSTFITSVVFILAGGIVMSVIFYLMVPLPPFYKLSAVILFEVVCLIWLTMIFISSVKNYRSIVNAFATGVVASLAGAFVFGSQFGAPGHLFGYTLGQAIICFWLLARLLLEFPATEPWNGAVRLYFRKYWDLMAIGFIYNMAIWVDKFAFWLAPDARVIIWGFVTHDIYEAPVFYSYLTIVPTMAIFLIRIETDFYEHYRRYYSKVTGKAPLAVILEEKGKMAAMIRRSIRDVFVVQGSISLLCIYFAQEIASMGGLSPLQIPLFRVVTVGSFLMVLLSITIIVLFYFDLRMRVLLTVSVFLVLNAVLSWLTIKLGFQFYGYGFTYACFISLLIAFYMLYDGIRDLEYLTFTRQPV